MPTIAVFFFIVFIISAFLGTSVPMGRKIPMPPEHLKPKNKKTKTKKI